MICNSKAVTLTLNRPHSLEAKAWIAHVEQILNERIDMILANEKFREMYSEKLTEYFMTGYFPVFTEEDRLRLEAIAMLNL